MSTNIFGRRGRALAAGVPRDGIEFSDIQGNILKGYTFGECAYLFFSVTDPESARSWLGDLADIITTAERKPVSLAVNLGITCAGLRALQVPSGKLDRLPLDFRTGMAARASYLGDETTEVDGRVVPSRWHPPFGSDGDLHLVLMISGDVEEVERYIGAIRTDSWQCGISELDGAIRGRRLPGNTEHFGFVDGLSNPQVAGVSRKCLEDTALGVQPGEFICGLPTEDGTTDDDVPSLTRHGSYLVIRKLEQDAEQFDAMVRAGTEQTGLDDRLVRAKIMGRWPGGAPLTQHRDREPATWSGDDFDYSADPGSGCPLGAHARRANPRGGLDFEGRLENRHRLLRRGIPYGSRTPARSADAPASPNPDGGTGYGLVFACYQADIASQFEFVQSQWLGDGNTFALSTDVDPVAASPGVGGSGRLRLEGEPGNADGPGQPPLYLDTMARCVTSRGGEYFLVPGIRAIRTIAALDELYRAEKP